MQTAPAILSCRPPAPGLTPVRGLTGLSPGHVAIITVAGNGEVPGSLLRDLQDAVPWVPVCLAAPADPLRPALRLPADLDSRLHPVTLGVPHARHPDLAQRAMAAIRSRPAPEPADLAWWIARRLGRADWLPDLADAMAPVPAGESPAAARALRRRLARISTLARHEWRRLTMLARLPRQPLGVDRLAFEAGINPCYLRQWTRRLLGLAAGAYRHLPGWEPVIELALRRVGREGTIHQATTSIADQARGQSLPISG